MNPDIPSALRIRRAKAGLSLMAVADGVGVTPRTVSSWENGRHEISLSKAVELCGFYGIGIAELVEDTDGHKDELAEIAKNVRQTKALLMAVVEDIHGTS